VSARVMVFIDYQNVHLIAHRRFAKSGTAVTRTHVDPLQVARLLVSRRHVPSQLVGVRVYRGQPNPLHQPESAAAFGRQITEWNRSPLVTTILRPLRYPSRWPAALAQEKGIDVALATDFLDLAWDQQYDVGILFSSDTDLVPAVERVYKRQLARVEVAAWLKANRLWFPGTNLPWCHYLTGADYLAVADPTDYTKPT
jgi:uncharacterized LabA/DUF88 family protein